MNKRHDGQMTHDNGDLSFDNIAKKYHSFKRQQKQKFQDYIIEHDPALVTAIAEESARFDVVRRDVIEPAMHEVAALAATRGYHVFVTTDDEMDRLVLIGSPSIRFYCSRQSFAIPVNDLLWSPSFIAFYGCPKIHGVQSCLEIMPSDENSPQPRDETPLEYEDVNKYTVRNRLLAFIEILSVVDIK